MPHWSGRKKATVMQTREHLLTRLGFRFGSNGSHAARTMMLGDLALLFERLPADAGRAVPAREIVGSNVLGKPTRKARELALRHLAALYGLDPSLPLFRALRRLWAVDDAARPLLALFVALASDPLLRGTRDFILAKRPGEAVSRDELERLLSARHPGRFSPASLKSFAQNINGTWTQAGFLDGRVRKTRSLPAVAAANVAFALWLGYLEGRSGQRLFTSSWTELLGCPADELEALAGSASQRGMLVLLNAGGVKDVRFPGYLTPQEERLRQEASHVV